MIFVDTNVIMYAVGGEHPLRERARAFFEEALVGGRPLVTSAEVLQELLHVYLPVQRVGTLDAALALVTATVASIWPVEEGDVRLARELANEHPGLGARDLLHLASCLRRNARGIMTFDRGLEAAFQG
jgi:uncharacterized protein